MSEYQVSYTDQADRQVKIEEQEALGRQMLYDDVLPGGNVLTFFDPPPPTQEELDEMAESAALAQAEDLIDAITNLAEAKVFLIRLVRRLIRNGSLP